MKHIFLIFVLFNFIFFSCSLSEGDDSITVVDADNVLFLKDVLSLENGEFCSIEDPIIYEDKLIVMIWDRGMKEGRIECYDKETLDKLWTWNEAVDETGILRRGFGGTSYIYEGILCIAESNLSYGINMETGSTIWENVESDSGLSGVFGNKYNICSQHFPDFNHHDYIKVADSRTGEWRKVFENIQNDSFQVQTKTPLPFTWNGIDYVTFVTVKWKAYPPEEFNWLNLYNLTEDRLEWTSDTIPKRHPLSGTAGVQPEFEDGQILLANDAIYSYNIEDGSLEWWKKYKNRFVLTSHLTVGDGKVFGNNEDQFIVGLNVHSGEEIFKTTTGGSTSTIIYNDGKCYMSDVTVGQKSKLMIIDAENGTMLQSENSPFRAEDSNLAFSREITVDPETQLVYTFDHRSLLVYDFN